MMKKKGIGVKLTLKDIERLPYDPAAPIKKGATVYKVNSEPGNINPNGTRGKTLGATKNSTGSFNYLVEFRSNLIIEHNSSKLLAGFICEVDSKYLSETKPNSV